MCRSRNFKWRGLAVGIHSNECHCSCCIDNDHHITSLSSVISYMEKNPKHLTERNPLNKKSWIVDWCIGKMFWCCHFTWWRSYRPKRCSLNMSAESETLCRNSFFIDLKKPKVKFQCYCFCKNTYSARGSVSLGAFHSNPSPAVTESALSLACKTMNGTWGK